MAYFLSGAPIVIAAEVQEGRDTPRDEGARGVEGNANTQGHVQASACPGFQSGGASSRTATK